MRKKRKKVWSALILAFAISMALSGCQAASDWVNKTITVTRNLKKNELFKIGRHVMTVEEAKIFLVSIKDDMEKLYGTEIWDASVGDKSVADYVAEDLEANLAKLICMVQMAEDRGITLNRTEEATIAKAAETYYYGLSENDKQFLQINLEHAKKAFVHYYTVEKLVADVTKNVDLEVSDDEGRIITIQQIFVTDPTTAQTVWNKATGGSDFTVLSNRYNESKEFEMQIGREDVSGAFAEAAFSLASGEISRIVQTETGYHIIRCKNHFEVEKTLAHKSEIVALRKQEAFEAAYEAYVPSLRSYYNDTAWTNIDFSVDFSTTSRCFFDVYADYFAPKVEGTVK